MHLGRQSWGWGANPAGKGHEGQLGRAGDLHGSGSSGGKQGVPEGSGALGWSRSPLAPESIEGAPRTRGEGRCLQGPRRGRRGLCCRPEAQRQEEGERESQHGKKGCTDLGIGLHAHIRSKVSRHQRRRRRRVSRGMALARLGRQQRMRRLRTPLIKYKTWPAGYNALLVAGDVEPNPGPDDYQVDPPLVPVILEALGCPRPIGDAFARPHNALFRQPWGPEGDAFARSWRTSLLGPLWLNPPFHPLHRVEEKIRREGAYVVLICPGWRNTLPPLLALSTRHFLLPTGPTFRREGREHATGLHTPCSSTGRQRGECISQCSSVETWRATQDRRGGQQHAAHFAITSWLGR